MGNKDSWIDKTWVKVVAVLGTAGSLFLLLGEILESTDVMSRMLSPELKTLFHFGTNHITALETSIIGLLLIFICFLLMVHNNCKRLLDEARNKLVERKFSNSVKVVCFLTPDANGGFYKNVLSHLIQRASSLASLNKQLIIVPYASSEAFTQDPEIMVGDLKNVFPGDISGLFVIPADPEKNEGIIKVLKQNYPATVLLDVNISSDDSGDHSLPCFVGGDEKDGGTNAGILAADALRRLQISDPKILILLGRKTVWENQRVESFKEYVEQHIENPSIEITGALNYSREAALSEVQNWIGRQMHTVHPRSVRLDVIFACNDEMAVGALEAVENSIRDHVSFKHDPQIVGYDGSDEMRNLLKNRHPHIAGTVAVDIDKLATLAILRMNQLLDQVHSNQNGANPNRPSSRQIQLVPTKPIFPSKP